MQHSVLRGRKRAKEGNTLIDYFALCFPRARLCAFFCCALPDAYSERLLASPFPATREIISQTNESIKNFFPIYRFSCREPLLASFLHRNRSFANESQLIETPKSGYTFIYMTLHFNTSESRSAAGISLLTMGSDEGAGDDVFCIY